MLARPDTPGIYVQPVDSGPRVIAPARTDIAAFIGIAERGPIGVPVAVRTMRQFESLFGAYIGAGYLAYAVRGFFENGGAMCRVLRVAAVEATAARARVRLADGRFGLTLTANSAGTWGNGLVARVTPSRRAETLARPGGDLRVSPVASVQGMERLALVRITQGALVLWRIVAAVDLVNARLFWTHPDPEQRAGWEAPLAGIDPGLPFRIERIDHDVMVRERGRLMSVETALSAVPGAPRHMSDILRLPAYLAGPLRDSSLGSDHPAPPPPVLAAIDDGTAPGWGGVPLLDPSGSDLPLAGGVDGLIHLAPDDFIACGLDPLEATPDVAILACPDINIQPRLVLHDRPVPSPVDPCEPCIVADAPAAPAPIPTGELPPVFDAAQIQRVQAAMIDQCERLRDRVAIIDPPWTAARSGALGAGPVRGWRCRFDSAFGMLYHPWLAVPDPLVRGGTRPVPPSGHMAGQWAAMDIAVGVHRAAGDIRVAWAQAASLHVDPPTHGLLNSEGINVITARDGRPLRTLGARTMSSDPDWRFAPVRRLVCMLRDALDAATQWAVFEPNDDATRLLLQTGISSFLDRLWRRGALAGRVAAAAYAVRCDEVNNDATRRANGELHVDIAIAPSVPFEFIVLRVGRQANQFELVEDGALRGAMVGGAG